MYKLLIADDETEMRNLLVKYIQQKEPDLEVIGSVINGEEALRSAEEQQPDIVITDIFMPVMNGLEFLKKAQEAGLVMKAIIISGYDEFEYARRAISLGVTNYLLKPFSPMELQEILYKVKQELDSQRQLLDNMKWLNEQVDSRNLLVKERVLTDILNGKQGMEPPAEEILHTKEEFYCTCLFKMPLNVNGQGWDFSRQENVEEWMLLINEGYFAETIHAVGLCLDQNGAILLFTGSGASKEQFICKIENGITKLRKSLEKYYSVNAIFVLGGVYFHWVDLAHSYEEALSIWKSTLKQDIPVLVYGRQETIENQEKIGSSEQIKQVKEQIVRSVRMGQERQAIQYVDELMHLYASLAAKKADYIGISVAELVYDIYHELEKRDGLEEKLQNGKWQRTVKEQMADKSLLEIKYLLEEYIRMSCQIAAENQEKFQADQIVEDARYLIEHNLDYEDMNLEWLSGQLHFSANYVRQVFKQKTGESLMEYVIQKRMEKAGKLLTQTDMMIQEVAKICGYSNQRYFASSFKKYYDCTPTNFKKMMDQKEKKMR